jgi:rubrerythrin
MSAYDVSYNLDEIFEIAEQIERNGAAFYRKASGHVESEATRVLLDDLAGQEDEHEQTFAEMRRRLVSADASVAAYDVDETVALYLRAIAGQYVFNIKQEPEVVLTGDKSAADVLRMAIDLEKDSIAFYVGLKDALESGEDRDKLEQILREEQKHVVELSASLEETCREPRKD